MNSVCFNKWAEDYIKEFKIADKDHQKMLKDWIVKEIIGYQNVLDALNNAEKYNGEYLSYDDKWVKSILPDNKIRYMHSLLDISKNYIYYINRDCLPRLYRIKRMPIGGLK